MKVLIVDDEKLVREAIKQLTDWTKVGIDTVLEADDGDTAIELIVRERPELIVADMVMPGRGGGELLEWVRENLPSSKTIVISGYRDIDLLRQAVKGGGTDMLLKPFDQEQFQRSIERAAAQWRQEEQRRVRERLRSMEVNRLKQVYRDKLLSDLMTDLSSSGAIRDPLFEEFLPLRQATQCRVAILSLDTMPRSLGEKFAANTDLLYFALINICNELLLEPHVGIAFRYWNSQREIVLLLWDELERAVDLVAGINEAMHRTLQGRFDFGIGKARPFPAGLRDSYREAQKALRQRNLLVRSGWIHEYEESGSPTVQLHFADYEENIRIAVRGGLPEQIRPAVQSWIDAVKRLDRITVEQLDLWRNEYNVFKTRWLHEFFNGKAPDLKLPSESANFIVPMDEEGNVSIDLWEEELTECMLRLSKRLAKRPAPNGSVIHQVAQYIRNHYYRDLTLRHIADRFFLSREYISRKFKQEFGENVVAYLSRIRIEKAKALLLNDRLKVSEVSQMVGYPDEKYFSKVFKKQVGISPNDYRKQMSRPR